jgi:hypothetical protein
MHLPNYFLADLPPGTELSVPMLTEACLTLKRNRLKYLAPRSTEDMIEFLSHVAAEWRRPTFHLRRLALDEGPAATGFSPQTIGAGLDSFFSQLTPSSFRALLRQDLGHLRSLDEIVSSPDQAGHPALATAPELVVHIAAGNLPVPALQSLVLGLLVRSAQFMKCASGASLLPRLFAHSIYEVDRKLGACLEIGEWPGGSARLEDAVFDQAECVTATGTDETLAAIRNRLPIKTRFVGYGQRVSFAYITAKALSQSQLGPLAKAAAADAAAWDQHGCLSPHVIYVENAGAVLPEHFAEHLADEMAAMESAQPRGKLPPESAAAIASRRSLYEVRAAHSPDTRIWCSPESTAWTVVYETDPRFQVSCLNRFIYVKPVGLLEQALEGADAFRAEISTVGLAAIGDEGRAVAAKLARWGAARVCPLGRMQHPPLTWRHDGRPALGGLVTWTDCEV